MGGKSTTTQSTTKDPWAPAQPALNSALSGALDAFNTTYKGTGVADYDPLVTQGQNQIVQNANSGQISGLANTAANSFAGILGNGGLSQEQLGAIGGIGSSLGSYNANADALAGYLKPYASGDYLSQKNPYFDQALADSMSQASDAVNRQFSAAGRYGSGAHSGSLGTALGRIATDANIGEYRNQQQNQLNAINALSGMNNSQFGNTLAGQGALAGLGQQGVTNTGAIASSLSGLQDAQNLDAQSLAAIGGQKMDYQQSLIDAANQNPWANVGNLAQIASGIGSLGGTSYTVGTQKTDPGIAGIIGGALTGLGGVGNLMTGWSNLFGGAKK